MSAAGRAAWADVAALADRLGVLTEADAIALASLAEAVGAQRAALASLDEPLIRDGVTVAGPGEQFYWAGPLRRPRPELAVISDADRRIGMWSGKFGLTPADRSKVNAAPAPAANPFDEI